MVGVGGAGGHDPGIAGFEEDGLAFELKLGAAGEDEADGFVVSGDVGLGVGGLLVVPEAHGDGLAAGEVGLTLGAVGGMRGADLLDGGVGHERGLRGWGWRAEAREFEVAEGGWGVMGANHMPGWEGSG